MTLQLPEHVVEREIEAICGRYWITPEVARMLFDEYAQRRPDLLRVILAKLPEQDVTRLKAYKTLIKDVRKHIYYYLRQYQPEKDAVERLRQQLADMIAASAPPQNMKAIIQQLLHTHISTYERIAHYQEFYETMFGMLDPPRTIVDVGCGIHPLSYPYGQADYAGFGGQIASIPPELYVAIDKQPEVIETLQIFAPTVAPTRLVPVRVDIEEATWVAYLEDQDEMFELAVMLKLIPVIARQQRHLMVRLAQIPARYMLITAAAEAMTRKQNIRKREERFLREFIELTDRQVRAAFQVGSEFGFLLDMPGTGTSQKFS